MKQFKEMYDTARGKERIDGILAVDTHVLVEALKILGPMYIKGREFSAETDKRCDCPKAVYELEDYSTRPVNYLRTDEERKDVIGILLRELMQKALECHRRSTGAACFRCCFPKSAKNMFWHISSAIPNRLQRSVSTWPAGF